MRVVDMSSKKLVRVSNRLFDQLRPIKITYNAFGYAAGTVLFELGQTKLLCAVSMQQGVPHFLKGTRTGWLMAEYAMLPMSTHIRSPREAVAQRRNGRSTEISRLIGRVLRSIVRLDSIGERTIVVDCDVLQADGGTRTAAISGACLALKAAEQQWLADGMIDDSFVMDEVAAISVGMVHGEPLLDLDYAEDNIAEVDFNFILTSSGSVIEIQGAVEQSGKIFAWHDFDNFRSLAIKGIDQLFKAINAMNQNVLKESVSKRESTRPAPFFSLKNRINKN